MPYHYPTVIAGVLYDLAHLDPVIIETHSDKLAREIRTWCRFTTHVFSRKPEVGETGPFITDEGRRPRLFCPERYALSLHLPAAIAHLANPRRRIWETASERNWLHSAEVNLVLNGEPVGYQVFFAVKKAARADPYDVELTVESAYAFDPARRPKLKGPMLIVGLLTATVEGRRPHTQRGGRNR